MLAAVAAATLVAIALPCAGVESFLAPNPQAPDAVPYRRSPGALTPRSDVEAEEGDAGSAAETKSPAPAEIEDDGGSKHQD